MAKINELTRIEQDMPTGLYCVKLLSAATGAWIVVGEWPSLEQAQADQRAWNAGVEADQTDQGRSPD
jgi:hypothetical protein